MEAPVMLQEMPGCAEVRADVSLELCITSVAEAVEALREVEEVAISE
jgi:hypothetical protein